MFLTNIPLKLVNGVIVDLYMCNKVPIFSLICWKQPGSFVPGEGICYNLVIFISRSSNTFFNDWFCSPLSTIVQK